MSEVILHTEKLIIRQADEMLLPLILDFLNRNKLFFQKWEPLRKESFYSSEVQLQNLKALRNDDSQYRFYLFTQNEPDTIVGEIGLSNIVKGVYLNCTISYKLDQSMTGRGIMSEALREIEVFVFETLKLHRIEANIIPTNLKSLKLIRKLGFREEGLSKQLLKINGIWEDHLRFAKLNPKNI
ncbi:MAG: GNAT family protein [Bacteroidota bacterium]